MDVIGFLFCIIVLIVVVYALNLLLDALKLPSQIRTLIMLAVGLLVLWVALSKLGLVGGVFMPLR